MAAAEGFLIADTDRVQRLLDDLARLAHARLGDEFAVVGIRRRGVPLAEALQKRLEVLRGGSVPCGEIELKRYADDLSLLHEDPELGETEFPFELEGASVLLVDDVEYTGRTLFAAADVLLGKGVERVHGAVLASRGENDVPATSAFVGIRLDVGEGNVVEVHAPPYEKTLAIHVLHQEDID